MVWCFVNLNEVIFRRKNVIKRGNGIASFPGLSVFLSMFQAKKSRRPG